MELLHFLKLIVDMRSDNENHKYTNWRVNYLFSQYLFGKNFAIMSNLELMFVSLVAICKTADDAGRERNEREDAHRSKMLALFSSIIDFYTVLFRGFKRGLSNYVANNKKLNAETIKNYLKMQKLSVFFEGSGKKTLVSAGSKKRGDDINLKFLKMLLNRCDEFAEFVRFVHKKEIEEHLDVVEFQYISILNQLLNEAEERKKRQDEGQLEPHLTTGKNEDSDDGEAIQVPETQLHKKHSQFDQRGRADSEAIMYEQDDEDEGHPALTLQKRPSAVDDKTKDYLALVRKFQYEDEYDDTHDVGDGRNHRKPKPAQQRHRRNRSEDSEPEEDFTKGTAFPVEHENEDSGEDVDPMNKWERTQSNMQEGDTEDGPLRRNTFRGGGRGGQGSRGGNKIDGKREKHNQSKYSGRRDDYGRDRDGHGTGYQARNDDYRQKPHDGQEGYKPRGYDGGDGYRPREGDQRDGYRQSDRGRGDKGQQGFRPKQGPKDTR